MPCQITPYLRRANYYETDQMKIIHHSNYIRWFEEARLDFMRKAGLDYEGMENNGIVIPVTGVSCRYLIPIHFNEVVEIHTSMTFFNGVRASYSYAVYTAGGKLAVTGESGHCFVDGRTGTPVNLQKRESGFFEKGMRLIEQEQAREKE